MLARIKHLLSRLLSAVEAHLPLPSMARSRLLTTLYLNLKGVYRVEQRALLNGLATYQRDVRDGEPLFRLRRNTHRLEKGLSSAERRDVFAESYILDTVRAFNRVRDIRQEGPDDPTLTWAEDVLTSYFQTVSPTPRTEEARRFFRQTDVPSRRDNFAPYDYALGEPAVDLPTLRTLAEQRVSVRRFANKAVARELLDAALDVGIQSPSACNRLPYEFRFYDDDMIRAQLADLAPGMGGWGHEAPVICVLVGKYRAYFHPRDRHAIYVDASLAAMPFQLALVSLGLGSCSVNWPQIPALDRRIGELLHLDPDEKVVMLLAIGVPAADARVPYSGKRTLDEVRSYNRRS